MGNIHERTSEAASPSWYDDWSDMREDHTIDLELEVRRLERNARHRRIRRAEGLITFRNPIERLIWEFGRFTDLQRWNEEKTEGAEIAESCEGKMAEEAGAQVEASVTESVETRVEETTETPESVVGSEVQDEPRCPEGNPSIHETDPEERQSEPRLSDSEAEDTRKQESTSETDRAEDGDHGNSTSSSQMHLSNNKVGLRREDRRRRRTERFRKSELDAEHSAKKSQESSNVGDDAVGSVDERYARSPHAVLASEQKRSTFGNVKSVTGKMKRNMKLWDPGGTGVKILRIG